MSKRINRAELFPESADITLAMEATAPAFVRCPTGHLLPHRVVWGRCSPLLCLDSSEPGTGSGRPAVPERGAELGRMYKAEMDGMPRGMEQEAINRSIGPIGVPEQVEAQTKEAGAIMRALGVKAARDAVMYFPDPPEPPRVQPGKEREWVDKRIDEMLPRAVMQLQFDLLYGSNEVKREVSKRILGMRGFSEKSDAPPDFRGPVVVLHMGGKTPYDSQQTVKAVSIQSGEQRVDQRRIEELQALADQQAPDSGSNNAQ